MAGKQNRHPQLPEIELRLRELLVEMKRAGYVPDVSSVQSKPGATDALKENLLCGNSERLAISCALINSPPGSLIRIGKNLRVCDDCHSATRIISRIENRARMQNFVDGACSCSGRVLGLSKAGEMLVRQLVSGESHTLVLTETGEIHAWGRGLFGRLGTGKEDDELRPVQVPGFEGKAIVSIAAGSYHSLALSDEGEIWSWGYNAYGQLAREEGSDSTPCPVGFPSSPSKIISLVAGGMISCAIDEAGTLWCWGLCPSSLSPSSVPQRVSSLLGRNVLGVACGSEHVLVLVSGGASPGACFSWGRNSHGQLGLGDKEPRSSPVSIPGLRETSQAFPLSVSCGAFHSAAIVQQVGRMGSSCWTFGLGENGQLGHGTSESSDQPVFVHGLGNVGEVECGLFHTACVSEDGDVFVWGMQGGFGLCPAASGFSASVQGDCLVPRKMFRVEKSAGIACGSAHTMLVVDEGSSVIAWGRGEHGVLGNGSEVDCFTPTRVVWQAGGESNVVEREEVEEKTRDSTGELREEIAGLKYRIQVLESGVFGGQKLSEFEDEIERASLEKLVKLEEFYRRMKRFVGDVLLQKKVEHWCSRNLVAPQRGDSPGGLYSVDDLNQLSMRLKHLQ